MTVSSYESSMETKNESEDSSQSTDTPTELAITDTAKKK